MAQAQEDTRVQLRKTAFVVYEHTDLDRTKQFYKDFGLSIAGEGEDGTVYFRGYGTDPYIYVAKPTKGEPCFGGAAYDVEDRAQLEKATKIPGATPIRPLDGPGGGEIVTVKDPYGHLVHLVFGRTERVADDLSLEKLVVNYEDDKPRKGRFQRFESGPAPIHKWGHYGVTYPEGKYQEAYDWYTKNLSLAPSDIVHRGDDPVVCFFHIDRGLEFTDHHAFFIRPQRPGEKNLRVAHSAFEVHDFDIQQLGHQFLTKQGYELCWGVGRHVLGSQVFDYWFDDDKFVVEHYADGDLVNSETKIAHMQVGPDSLAVWGPPVPAHF